MLLNHNDAKHRDISFDNN